MFIERPLFFLPWLFPKAWWRKDKNRKVVYLTFDDGPVPEITPVILKMLDEFQIKATFFCVGDNVRKHPEVFQQVIKQGHRVGNHTFNHIKGFSWSVEAYLENVEKAASLINSDLIRPPHGQLSQKLYRALNERYQVVMWDVITRDYNQALQPERILKNVKKYVRNGSIVVFHDSLKAKQNVLTVLPDAIRFLQQQGYQFKTL
ncbi:polysaccharide deacetylase family protein [Microbacter margulisiae]|uniref:Peptidoglycan/xylan/chitin deacetylase (PgdA/CDA1 family) n=1 Tax=Microbacter margulisiae TaxID=1350067 RepID=A0A7W5DSY7_9PORP|nr:polysaccharide deacetylase family protein [Microbacter margulisiae]MBB3188501.1 peptidoglycan/xylan/chitin deacetylase (PgdA/CDA1 family) [Microbacter margulisiae]